MDPLLSDDDYYDDDYYDDDDDDHSDDPAGSHDLSWPLEEHGPPVPIRSDDGGPLVVFQGNDSLGIHGADGGSEAGIFLSPRRRYAARYGPRLHRTFVAFSNPLRVENKGEISPRDLTHADLRRLIAAGYDGIVVKSPGSPDSAASEIVAFSKRSLLPDLDAYMDAREARSDYEYGL